MPRRLADWPTGRVHVYVAGTTGGAYKNFRGTASPFRDSSELLTHDLDLQTLPRQRQTEPARLISRSAVVYFKNYHPHTQTHPIDYISYIATVYSGINKVTSRSTMAIQLHESCPRSMIVDVRKVSVVGEELSSLRQTGRLLAGCSRVVVQQ